VCLVHFQGIIEDYLEVRGVGGRGSRRVSVRHECKSRVFVRAREGGGGYLSDRWVEGNLGDRRAEGEAVHWALPCLASVWQCVRTFLGLIGARNT